MVCFVLFFFSCTFFHSITDVINETVNDTGSYGSDDFEESVEQSTEQSAKAIESTAKVQQSAKVAYDYADDNSDFEDDDRYGVKDFLNESRGSSENLEDEEEELDESGSDRNVSNVRHMLPIFRVTYEPLVF